MGSSNRDYMQDDSDAQGPTWGHDVPTTKWLLIVTVVVFFLQTLMIHKGSTQSYVEDWLLLESGQVLHGQVWRLVTYVFCHDRQNPFQIVFNMVALWYLGSALERMYGSREIFWFYLASALVCGLIFTAFGLKMILPYPLKGAGACVMALLTLYATHFPRQEILFCWIVPIQIRVLLGIYVAVYLYQFMQAYSGMAPLATMAYLSELWGVGFGYAYRRFDWHLAGMASSLDVRKLPRSMRRASTARKLKVFAPEPVTNLEEQVDAILAKIHEQGSESLTDRERSILQRASEEAKNRL